VGLDEMHTLWQVAWAVQFGELFSYWFRFLDSSSLSAGGSSLQFWKPHGRNRVVSVFLFSGCFQDGAQAPKGLFPLPQACLSSPLPGWSVVTWLRGAGQDLGIMKI
jgi:hypothetical protein